MQLKKIEIQGFKSFADKTEIVFLDGVTTIVGPNGSGKSNISDAIKWVLGEQSVKTLRGSKMEDVIFAGTEARKKLGFAEVSMYLDNSDASLPVDYSEVVVTRRVFRNGDSAYLINSNECRLKDIQELFMDTGVGKDGYSIIGQGKIDEILSSKSDERRHIFEEASGIVKYRVRKEESVRKLQNTSVSLDKVNTVLKEIEGLIEPLAVKAETAKKYLSLKESLKNIDIRIFVSNLSKSDEELKNIEEEIESIKESVLNSENETTKLQDIKQNLKQRLEEIILKIEQMQENFFKSENEKEKINSEIEVENNNISHEKGNIVRLQTEINENNEKITLLNEEINSKKNKKVSMEENRKKFEVELNDKQSELNILLKSLDEKGKNIEELKAKIDESNEKIYELKIENSSLSTTVETNIEQIDAIKKSSLKNVSSKDSALAFADDIYMNLNDKKSVQNNIKSKVKELQDKKDEISNQVSQKEENILKLKEDILTSTSKLNYLKNLDAENEGYLKSVKDALEFAQNSSFANDVYGTLASLIKTSEQTEYAIEISLAGFMQNIVCEKEEQAKQIIEYLKENSLGRVTFLPLNNIKKVKSDIDKSIKKLDGVIGYAIELVDYEDKYRDAIELALYNILIVDNLENGLKISKKVKNNLRIVTLSGELLSQNGSITGGKNKTKSLGLIGRKDKIEAIEALLEKKKEKIELYEKEKDEVLTSLNAILKEFEELKSQEETINIEVATLEEKYQNAKREIAKFEENKLEMQNKQEQLIASNEKINQDIAKNEELMNTLEKEIEEFQAQVDEYSRFNKDKQTRIDYLSEDVVNLKISLSSFDESVASIEEMEEKITSDINNFKEAIEKKNTQISEAEEIIKKSEENIVLLNNKITEISNFKNDFESTLNKLKEERDEISKKEISVDENIVQSIKLTEKIRETMAKVESKKIKIDVEKDNLKNKMWDEYEITITSAQKIFETLPELEKGVNINKEAESLRKKISALGEVSVSSIEEYAKTKERFDFISAQKVDLEQTKEKLENLIENMTSIMKNQFSKQFKLIRQNFSETFKELFGGGKADLILSDESNILESGIEIEVQPPGKKLQNMMLLSGGERALTATALLFAILRIKTPPFCILDEIEAALDDVNVHRFAEYIKKYSKDTQFIVITHRKGTMEVAKCTYGVTMQEYGISKIISMKMK